MLTLFVLVLSRVHWARQITDLFQGQVGTGTKAASVADEGRGPVRSTNCRVRGHHTFPRRVVWLLYAALSSFPRPPAVLVFPATPGWLPFRYCLNLLFFQEVAVILVGIALSNFLYLLFLMLARRQGKNVLLSSSSGKMDLYLLYVYITISNPASNSWQSKSTFNHKSESTFQLRLQNPVSIIKPTFSRNKNFKIQSSPSTPLHTCVLFNHQHNFIILMLFISFRKLKLGRN